MPQSMLESRIRKKILDFLNSLSESSFEISPPGSNTGKADITGCLKGRYVAVEVKRPGYYPTKIQYYWLTQKQKAKGIAFPARSVLEVKWMLGQFKLI